MTPAVGLHGLRDGGAVDACGRGHGGQMGTVAESREGYSLYFDFNFSVKVKFFKVRSLPGGRGERLPSSTWSRVNRLMCLFSVMDAGLWFQPVPCFPKNASS